MSERSVTFYRWDEMPKEPVSDMLDRRLITADQFNDYMNVGILDDCRRIVSQKRRRNVQTTIAADVSNSDFDQFNRHSHALLN